LPHRAGTNRRHNIGDYLREQEAGTRDVLVAEVAGHFAGYVTIVWESDYLPFRADGIPEIVDLNVLIRYRRQGIAAALLDKAERRIGKRAPIAGIGVGMTADYGAAQILYVKRGYRPDGRGLAVHGISSQHGDQVTVDDALTLYLTKRVARPKRPRSTAIVETPQGILLAAMADGLFLLPGGGIKVNESAAVAAIRELHEEAGLFAESVLYLFDHESSSSHHKVFYVQAVGQPQLCSETCYLAYYTPGADLYLSDGTRDILARFLALKTAHPDFFTMLGALREHPSIAPR
jgi:8-oxo-dGTP pyrophosphatase MutT (NUDIX family)